MGKTAVQRESYILLRREERDGLRKEPYDIIVACVDYSLIGRECPRYMTDNGQFYRYLETLPDSYPAHSGILCIHRYRIVPDNEWILKCDTKYHLKSN